MTTAFFRSPRSLLLSLTVAVAMASCGLAADAPGGKRYTQIPEMVVHAEQTDAARSSGANIKAALNEAPPAFWIWGQDQNKSYVVRQTFQGDVRGAWLQAACDNVLAIYVNGQSVGMSDDWQHPVDVDVQKFVKTGENVVSAEISNAGGPAAFVCRMALSGSDGRTRYVVSDESWQVAETRGATDWSKAKAVARYGAQPWGNALAGAGATSARNQFNVLPGFRVERLFTVPKDELGSWVCITTDNKGRLLVSDQNDNANGLCRITPPPIGSQEPTQVERLNVKMSSAQGLLWAFDSLYVSLNGSESGLYRLKDTDGDDQFDEVVKLKGINGGGEHGPHALRLSPDGKSILLIAGNHTGLPFQLKQNAPPQTLGGVRAQQLHVELPASMTSRLAPNWDEDLLLPRQWDGLGHAAGILAPGGWIAKTDPDGKNWEIISSGYRNPYDFALNADGELFSYDADMEWDFGMPWYRPTRVVHATSGSEFGWRSGTGKWPAYYVDSLPPLVNVGPGSPVGIEFGYGAKFPARYQRALFICDWTFGTMYAIHMEPSGASYAAVKEEFLSRTPLPLTDLVVGRDGALYFTVGGRGTQSELYRVTYGGQESTAAVDYHEPRDAELREVRRRIEAYHVAGAEPGKAAAWLLPYLGHADRHIRYAARVGLERVPVEHWQDQVVAAADAQTVITGVVGLARQAEPTFEPLLLAALGKIDFARIDEPRQLELLRAYQLVLTRLGLPPAAERAVLGEKLAALFPASPEFVNRELAILMVALESPNVVHKLLPTLLRGRVAARENLGDVLGRNPGYGGTVAAVLANQPDQQQVAYVFALRNLKTGWTMDQRKTYFAWFAKARQWSGGASYQNFLNHIEADAYENCTDSERLLIEAAGVRTAYKAPVLPKPVGPGRDYTLDELMAWSTTRLQGRNFKDGQRTFAAARCIVCHRFAADGGATGPDLTQAAGRFGFRDLAEAILDPSKVVSDQYRTTVVQTSDGKSYSGRVLSVTDDSLMLLVNPEDPSQTVIVKKADIERQQSSPVSMMPRDLLKQLNENEVLDLMAYLLSRGNAQDVLFKQ